MTTPTYFVLASLLASRLHGYAIIETAEGLSGGTVRLTTGTLYGALDRLQSQGLIEDDGQETVDGRLRRYYRLTSAGADAVHSETARMQRAVSAVGPRLAARGLAS